MYNWLSVESYKVEVEEECAIIEVNRRRITEQSQMGVSEENYKLIMGAGAKGVLMFPEELSLIHLLLNTRRQHFI